MTGKLPPSASVTKPLAGAKLHAPAAERNVDALCDLLRQYAPETGDALEIASGTGQHVVAFARACPRLQWFPTELGDDRLASIAAYRQEAALSNIAPPQRLDGSEPEWHKAHPDRSLILAINLLHLISTENARVLVAEAVAALASDGRFILYGPFMRDGILTSEGDARFHAQLSNADPSIGYKNDGAVERWLIEAGARTINRVEMPANNLALIAAR